MAEWFKFEIERWEHGTADLPDLVEYAYFKIIVAMNKFDAPIQNDDKVLARLLKTRTDHARRRVEELIRRGKLIDSDGWLTNRKAEQTISERRLIVSKRRLNASTGGIATANRKKSLDQDVAFASPTGHNRTLQEITEEKKERERGEVKPNGHATVRATRLKKSWEPTKEDLRIAVDEGFTDSEILRILTKFRDHYQAMPSPQGLKVDWSAQFRNWVRTENDRRKH